jgi:type II secretory pathway pseudopilin PulG
MRMQIPAPRSSCRGSVAPVTGFTLPELLISIGVFAFLVIGIVFANLYGLSMFHITETTLNATDAARKTIGKMTDEIRTCSGAYIGNVKNGTNYTLFDGEVQQGTSLLISNNTSYVMYFVNPTDKSFRRTTSTPGSVTVLAEFVTNAVVFSAQDYLGRVLTNNQNNRVIHLNLEFYQAKRAMQIAQYYKLETSVTRRVE